MRRILLVTLGLYLAVGVAFGLVTDQASHLCAPEKGDKGTTYYGAVNGVPDIPWRCLPTIGPVDRLRWVAITTPGWLPIVIRDIAH